MNRPNLIIFDCDGVLIDSEPLASRTLSEALRNAGIDLTPLDVHMQFTGKAESEIRRICNDNYGLQDIEAVFAGWHASLYAAFARDLQPMAGMIDLVQSVHVAKCVASNSRRERLLVSLGQTALWPAFAPHIYGADSVAHPKPAPDLLLHCAKAVGAAPDESVMIDDSPHGIAAAVAAGMTPIGFVDPADPRPDRVGVLRSAGARYVATGAAELTHVLRDLGCPVGKAPELQAANHI